LKPFYDKLMPEIGVPDKQRHNVDAAGDARAVLEVGQRRNAPRASLPSSSSELSRLLTTAIFAQSLSG